MGVIIFYQSQNAKSASRIMNVTLNNKGAQIPSRRGPVAAFFFFVNMLVKRFSLK